MTRGKKRILWSGGVLALLVLMGVVSVPLWLPWIFGPLTSKFGLQYRSYTRLGYGRFALHDAVFTNETVRVAAGRIEAPLPATLVWNRKKDGSELLIEHWSVSIRPGTTQSRAAETNGPTDILARVQEYAGHFAGWIERAALTNGAVTFQQQTASVPWLVWNHPAIDASIIAATPKVGDVPAGISLRLDDAGSISGQITAPTIGLRSFLQASPDSKGLSVRITNYWRTNVIVASATFQDSVFPLVATVSAPALFLPGSDLPMRGIRGLRGGLAAGWTNGSFASEVKFDATSEQTNVPPIFGTVIAYGDTNSATVQSLEITSPGFRVQLSEPVRFNYDAELLSGPARLTATGELSRLPLSDIAGLVRGEIEIRPSTNAPPEVDANIALDEARVRGIDIKTVTGRAELRWPLLHLPQASAKLSSGADVHIQGAANLTNRHISAASMRLEGLLPTNIIPSAARCSNILVTIKAHGPLTSLVHEATVKLAAVRLGPLAPMDVHLTERGEHFRVTQFDAIASGPSSAIQFTGSGKWNATHSSADISALNYWSSNKNTPPLYALAQPFKVQLTQESNAPPRIEVAELSLRGDNRHISASAKVTWPNAGFARLSLAGLRTSDFTNILLTALPAEAIVPRFAAAAEWSNGPVQLAFEAVAQIITTSAPPVELSFGGTNGDDAIHLTNLSVTLPNDERRAPPMLAGDARLPVSVTVRSNGMAVTIHSNSPMRLQLQTSTNEIISTLLADLAKLEAIQPSLQVSLDGTINEPRGWAHLSAVAVASRSVTNVPLPRLEDLRADLVFNPTGVRLSEFRATLAGQPITASAEIPIEQEGNWKSRLQLNKAHADLRMPAAELAAFTPFFTNVLAPRGTLELMLALRPGTQLSGHVKIRDAATKVFPAIGSVQGINADIRLQDRAVVIKSLEARAGGAPLIIAGAVNFSEWQEGSKRWPDIRLHISGTNVAIVRQAQSLIRSDINLQVTNRAHGTPAIGGALVLRDSLFLANLNDLVPRGVTKPSERPPYFNVDADLLHSWPLNIHVQGEKFLTVRTPLFRGEVSANVEVRGQLGEPLALGQVRINSGKLLFPFATLSVKQGFINLGSANPYAPELFVTAVGRSYDYDIRLEVTGSAQKPILEFTSVPPLTSEQVLLMVTSGQIPRSDFALSTEQRAQKLGMFVGKNVLSQLGFGGGDENLTIRSGESISERGRSTYSVEYKLTEDVSLVGEYDRFDEYNAGIHWRVFSK